MEDNIEAFNLKIGEERIQHYDVAKMRMSYVLNHKNRDFTLDRILQRISKEDNANQCVISLVSSKNQ